MITTSPTSWKAQTNTAVDAGDNALWDYLDFQLDIDKANLADTVFNVCVKDKNSLTSDGLVGEGSISIRRALHKLGSLVELSVNLFAGKDKKTPAGRVVLSVDVKEPEPEPILDRSFVFGSFFVTKIRTFDLKNTELFGLQDPFCVLKFGQWTTKTFTKENGGSDVLWDFLDFQCDVVAESISSQMLEVSLFDENDTRADVLIGNGSTSLLKCGGMFVMMIFLCLLFD